MTRRQALHAIAGAVVATKYLEGPSKEPLRVIFEDNCFSELIFKSKDGDVVVKWSEVIEALR